MGDARWKPDDWSRYAKSTASKPRDHIYTSRRMHPDLDPLNIPFRESVDSDANPQSTPIIVALDVTGSMGMIPDQLIRGPLGTFIEEILDRKPVSDPHLMFMGVGDAESDSAPLQVTQFEADLKIADQLAQIWLEGLGGNNRTESYHLPWYFAGMKTRTDAMLKRGRKGYLFTVGDEEAPGVLKAAHLKKFLGEDVERDFTAAEVLAMAQRSYHVFHVVVEQGSHCRAYSREVFESWRNLLGQHVIPLSDYTELAEVLVSTIQAHEGADRDAVAKSWSGKTGMTVAHALKGLSGTAVGTGGLVRL